MLLIEFHDSFLIEEFSLLVGQQYETRSASSFFFPLLGSLLCNGALADFEGVDSVLEHIDLIEGALAVIRVKPLVDCNSVFSNFAVVKLIEMLAKLIEGNIEDAVVSANSGLFQGFVLLIFIN